MNHTTFLLGMLMLVLTVIVIVLSVGSTLFQCFILAPMILLGLKSFGR